MIRYIFKALESRVCFYTVSLLFKLILDIAYVTFQSPVYGYTGFDLNFSIGNYVLSWCFTIAIIVVTPNILKKVSDYFLVTFSFSLILPLLSLYGLNYELSFFPVLVSLCSYLGLFAILKTKTSDSGMRFSYIKNGPKIFQLVCYTMIGYLVIWYVASGAINNFNLDPSKVYQFRKMNSQLTNLGVLTYLNIWVYKVFNLSLIAYALLKKKRILFIALLLVQVFFYGVSAHKAVLFTPLIIISIYFYFTHTKALATVPLAFLLVCSISLIMYHYGGNSLPASLIINRVFFIPNYLTFVYFDFFSSHAFSYWSDSFNFLLSPVYPEGIPPTIGSYLGTNEFANNGFISSGFSQAGIYGVIFYVILTALILKVIDQFSEDVGVLWFALCIVITPLRSLIISADLMTTLLTHGLLLSILMLFLLRKPRQKL